MNFNSEKKLYKARTNGKIDGVCLGFANYFDVDVTLVRIIFVLFGLFGAGVLFYFICMLIMPREPYVEVVDNTNI